MDISGLLSDGHPFASRRSHAGADGGATHSYPTRNSTSAHAQEAMDHNYSGPITRLSEDGVLMTHAAPASANASPARGAKRVKFEYIFPITNSPKHRTAARLPMSVNIWPHDETASIIATVKNFFGLYEGQCVSFEDKDGNTLIAHHDNFYNGMTVFVRASQGDYDSEDGPTPKTLSPKRPRLGPPIQMDMLPPELPFGHGIARAASLNGAKRSMSPQSARSYRGTSVGPMSKARPRPPMKGRANSAHGSIADYNADPAHEDSDSASVSSSRRGKSEILASAEISVENIVEGGRRKRAKFDSSELPLFVPSQVPMTASMSSVSPQRRIGSGSAASPYAYNNAQTFAYPAPLPSPQSHNLSDAPYPSGFASGLQHPGAGQYGNRHGTRQGPARQSAGNPAVLPTPDPTIGGSVISDEDVALQLMRLGEASNFSAHGRTSTSTLNEDAYSGKAEVASSSGESVEASDGEDGLPYRREGEYSSGEDFEDEHDGSFKGYSDEIMPQALESAHKHKLGLGGARSIKSSKMTKARPQSVHKAKSKIAPGAKVPISPSSLPPQSRKASNASLNFQHQFGPDEEDLSSKPRCQRCRKSKKGCDRQRPCGRCKDAGIGIDGCISEDEGNGRKGRYGRHMGVPVKKAALEGAAAPGLADFHASPPAPPVLAHGQDAGKKRKR